MAMSLTGRDAPFTADEAIGIVKFDDKSLRRLQNAGITELHYSGHSADIRRVLRARELGLLSQFRWFDGEKDQIDECTWMTFTAWDRVKGFNHHGTHTMSFSIDLLRGRRFILIKRRLAHTTVYNFVERDDPSPMFKSKRLKPVKLLAKYFRSSHPRALSMFMDCRYDFVITNPVPMSRFVETRHHQHEVCRKDCTEKERTRPRSHLRKLIFRDFRRALKYAGLKIPAALSEEVSK